MKSAQASVFCAENSKSGIVYTETVVHLAPERFAADVPYQVAIIKLDDGGSITARIEGERVQIGDRVAEADIRDGIPFFKKLNGKHDDETG